MKNTTRRMRPRAKDAKHPFLLPKGFDPSNELHQCVVLAMKYHGLEGGDIAEMEASYEEAQRFFRQHNIDPDTCAQIRMPVDLFNRDDLSDLEFRVVAGVSTCAGQDPSYVLKVDWRTIAMRAMGAESEEMLERFGVKPLSRAQVESAIESLHKKKILYRTRWYGGSWSFIHAQGLSFQEALNRLPRAVRDHFV